MALTPSLLVAPAYAASSAGAAVLTVGASTRVSIKTILLNNLNTSAEVVKIYVGVGGVGAGNSNNVIQVSVAASSSVILDIPFPLILSATDKLYVSTTTASMVVLTVTGKTESV